MDALSRLCRPLDYLRVIHPAKWKYDYFIPTGIAVVLCGAYYALPVSPSLFGCDGIVYIVTDLLKILVGFYIASLAAIATFNKAGMDKSMPGIPPTLTKSRRGKRKQEELTRRRFLCLLFGYLSFMSMAVYFIGAVSGLVAPSITAFLSDFTISVLRLAFVLIYLFLASNLFVTTLLGLYYMTDRIHQHDPELKGGPMPPDQET